jgi:hypothetical protein
MHQLPPGRYALALDVNFSGARSGVIRTAPAPFEVGAPGEKLPAEPAAVALSARPVKKTFAEGEPLRFTLNLANTSRRTMKLDSPDAWLKWDLWFKAADGTRYKAVPAFKQESSTPLMKIEAEETIELVIALGGEKTPFAYLTADEVKRGFTADTAGVLTQLPRGQWELTVTAKLADGSPAGAVTSEPVKFSISEQAADEPDPQPQPQPKPPAKWVVIDGGQVQYQFIPKQELIVTGVLDYGNVGIATLDVGNRKITITPAPPALRPFDGKKVELKGKSLKGGARPTVMMAGWVREAR